MVVFGPHPTGAGLLGSINTLNTLCVPRPGCCYSARLGVQGRLLWQTHEGEAAFKFVHSHCQLCDFGVSLAQGLRQGGWGSWRVPG